MHNIIKNDHESFYDKNRNDTKRNSILSLREYWLSSWEDHNDK